MLLLDPEELAATDAADHAVQVLAEAQVQEVIVLGRRGPAQAAFTNPELRELGELTGVDVQVDPARGRRRRARGRADGRAATSRCSRATRRARRGSAGRRISLQFLRSPVEILGEGEDGPVTGMRAGDQPARGRPRRPDRRGGGDRLRDRAAVDRLPRQAAWATSRSTSAAALIRNEGGRVCDEDGTHCSGEYVRRLDQARAERRDRDEQEGRRRHGGADRRGPRGGAARRRAPGCRRGRRVAGGLRARGGHLGGLAGDRRARALAPASRTAARA